MSRNISDLHPRLQTKIADLKHLCGSQGLPIGIGECFRTVAEQDALYAQGRSTPGNIVTYARGSTYSSQHQWGIAFDFYKNIPGHAFDDIAFFNQVGALAKSIGLAWGGDWTNLVDRPHLYLPDWGDTPTPLKRQYGSPEFFRTTWGVRTSNLNVDGYWGANTTFALQKIFGTTKDGVISNQYVGWRTENSALTSGWEWSENPTRGSECIRALQRECGAAVDGFIGPNTISALQKWLGTSVDGYLSAPSNCVKALQMWCNDRA